jgi:DNA-binding transcriptional ArsR family regulator
MPTISEIGFAVSHETRVRALEALMSGVMLPNGELARACRVPASSMSEHLAVLLRAGLVRDMRSGRHHYYAIASDEAAGVIEAAGLLANPENIRTLRESECSRLEREARMCFNHLAGHLGVALCAALVARGALKLCDDAAVVTVNGSGVLSELSQTTVVSGSVVPCCVDYSERAIHLRGSIATSIAASFLSRKLLRRGPGRSLIVTAQGRAVLSAFL